MVTLTKDLRKTLENTVKEARRVAEEGAKKAIESLAVHNHEPWAGLTPEQRVLRNKLRAHGRQVGDKRDDQRGTQALGHLVSECAYEHWHRMLFARFLAENNLLIEPTTGVAITLQECQELARERSEDWLEMASGFAEGMLPQIFRQDDPVLDVTLPAETRSRLESMLEALSSEVFLADDSLGWVYQFWQAEKKDEVNRSEKKIGADELPAVTQLFTEDYMVLFLLHNTLGAWWAGKMLAAKPELSLSARNEEELRAACAVGDIEWTYLRFVREGEDAPWKPAAGSFDGWPKTAKNITMLDPCMGSGHFLVFALPILVGFRVAEEGLSEAAAIYAVLRDNLFGLEIDPRCTQIAAFNLAFAAWRSMGYRPLPPLNLACSGLSIGVSKGEWEKLAEQAAMNAPVPPEKNLFGTKDNLFSARIKEGLLRLYDLFAQAPTLGSLINPRSLGGTIFAADFAQLEPLFNEILRATHTDELAEMAVAAQGMAKAAEILAGQFILVMTNVPYLGYREMDNALLTYISAAFPDEKGDLGYCLWRRFHNFVTPGNTIALVTLQHWLSLRSYLGMRMKLFSNFGLPVIAHLGARAFGTITGEKVNITLTIAIMSTDSMGTNMSLIDVASGSGMNEKAALLRTGTIKQNPQQKQYSNPDHRISFGILAELPRLSQYADCLAGIMNGDTPKFICNYWEIPENGYLWDFLQSTVSQGTPIGGLENIIFFDKEKGHLREDVSIRRIKLHNADERGNSVWGRAGVAVSQMSSLPVSRYFGNKYDSNVATIVPKNNDNLAAIWAFCTSEDFVMNVRALDRKLNVTNATFGQVPFDIAHWKKVVAEKYPHGLPKPHSCDPTQWIFNGHPNGSNQSLQVAVERLAGYCWPRQTGSSFMDCPALGPDGLAKHAVADGIVCLTPLRGEPPADQRLIALLADAFGSEWSAGKLASLLTEVGFEGRTLDDWLRDGFFEQHCALFNHRPFIWHIWDGQRDGFHALVNYHKLVALDGEGNRTLEALIYAYLGDWIDRQRADQKAGIEGADGRVAAAETLKTELEKILAGEPPYDIFVRWKPLHEQIIGWDPDINDGVRLNIRPFMTAKPLGARAKEACILRATPKIKWGKDRGKESHRKKEEYPWFWGWDEQAQDFTGGNDFDGNRWNDLHHTNAFKQDARARRK